MHLRSGKFEVLRERKELGVLEAPRGTSGSDLAELAQRRDADAEVAPSKTF